MEHATNGQTRSLPAKLGGIRFSRKAVAEYLCLAEGTLAKWASVGQPYIPYYRVGKKAVYLQTDLDEFLNKNRVGGSSMNKDDVFNAFRQQISLKSIVQRNDEYVIQGKFCVISPMGKNEWDIWICNPDDLYNGLGQRKVRNIVRILEKSLVGTRFRKLTGEADAKIQGTELILQNLKLLGIRKKRELSSENLAKLRIQLGEVRRAA